MTVAQYLTKQGISFKETSGGNELVIRCPFCGNEKEKLYIHAGKGIFHCFSGSCGMSGTFGDLTERLSLAFEKGEIAFTDSTVDEETYPLTPIDPDIISDWHKNLTEGPGKSMLAYLHEKRGLTDETIKKFKLGWDGRNIVIPVMTANGDVVNCKLKPDPTRPTQTGKIFNIPGRGRKQLFNEKVLTKKQERVVVCEGEWDCMLLDQMGYASVTSTGGAGSFDVGWVDAFGRCEKVYICMDNDLNNAGQKGSAKISQMFYTERGIKTWTISLPPLISPETKIDISDFFLRRKKEKSDFTSLLLHARQFRPTLEQGQYNVITWKDLSGMEFPTDQWIVDHLIPTESLTVIGGLPATMKSYFMNYMISCVSQGIPVLGRYETKKMPILLIDKENKFSRLSGRLNKLGTPREANIHFWDGDFSVENDTEVNYVENYIVTHGIRLLVMDTLIRMHTKEENSSSEMNKVYQVLQRFKRAGATVLFIQHFRKPNVGYGSIGDITTMLRGSGDILAQVDTYIAIQRVSGGFLQVDIGKSRDENPLKPFLIEPYFEKDATYFNFMKEIEADDKFQIVMHEDVVYSALAKQNHTRGQLLSLLPISDSTLDRTLRKLKDAGRVTTFTNGNKEYLYTINLEKKDDD